MRTFLAFIALSLALLSAAAADQRPESLEIGVSPIRHFSPRDPGKTRFGALQFRGGLVLTSPDDRFGGYSALRVQADGARFIALSDRGHWLLGNIVYEGERPVRINAAMAPFLGPDGKPSGRWDTESLAENGNTLYVGIERENVILRLTRQGDGFPEGAVPIDIPAGVKELPNNQGLEALVYVPEKLPLGGALIALSERGLDKAGNFKAFLIGGPKPGQFAVKRTDGYDISDAALLPDGDLLILERKYSVLGPAARIRCISLATIRPDSLVDGAVIFEADRHAEIDNMEALSVHRGPSGEIILTLMSDDNHSSRQRTVLLQFSYQYHSK